MEIYKYEKNNSEIERRKTLKPFGDIKNISVLDKVNNFTFTKCHNDKIEIKEEVVSEQVAYTPNIFHKKKEETTVKGNQHSYDIRLND